MFDIGWTELVLIGVVALIVIGPKDLPEMFRQLGRFTAKLKSMSREFTRAMEQAANEAGVKDISKDINKIASPTGLGLNTVKDAADRFEKWDPLKNAAKPTVQPEPAKKINFGATPGSHDAAKHVAEVAAEHGPATQALIDKQAAKQAILKETTEKLKAVEAAPAAVSPSAGADTPAKPARKPRAKPAETAPDAEPKAAPRAPRKKKAPEA